MVQDLLYQEQENNPKIFSEDAQLIFLCFSRMKRSISKCKNPMGSDKPWEEREKPSENKVQEGWRMDVNGKSLSGQGKWRWDAACGGGTSLPPASLPPWLTPAYPSLVATSKRCAEGFTAALPQPHVALPNGYHVIIALPEAGSPLTHNMWTAQERSSYRST